MHLFASGFPKDASPPLNRSYPVELGDVTLEPVVMEVVPISLLRSAEISLVLKGARTLKPRENIKQN
jgi:hypothetical protein